MKTWNIGDTIPIRVRIDGDPTTDNPTAVVYDETDAPFGTPLTIGSGLTQVGTTKVVTGSFVPDANGAWSVTMVDDTGLDVVKQFYVGNYSLATIGALAATVEGKIDLANGKLDAHDLVLANILNKVNNIGGGGHFG